MESYLQIINSLILLGVGAMQTINLYYIRRTEKNTNSMKDALVASTGVAAHLQGREEARIEGVVKAAELITEAKKPE